MMNIQSALGQLRLARKLGKISNQIQARTLRRLGYAPAVAVGEKIKAELTAPPSAAWLGMMGLLESIKEEVAPILESRRQAERECYDIRFAGDTKRKEKVAPVVVARPAKRELVGYEYTVAWWNEMELKEREDRKAATVARNAAKELAPA